MKKIFGIIFGLIYGAVASTIVSLVVNLFGAFVGYANFKVFSAIIPSSIFFAILSLFIIYRPINNKTSWIISVLTAWLCALIVNLLGPSISAYNDTGLWLDIDASRVKYSLFMSTLMLPVTIVMTRLTIHWFQMLLNRNK